MRKNMGQLDQILRIMVAVLIAVLYDTNVISGSWAIGLGILATIFIITSVVSFCPLYLPFGINTRKKKTHG